MEKRAILAIVLSLFVVVVWMFFFAPQPPAGPPPIEQRDRETSRTSPEIEGKVVQQIPTQKARGLFSSSSAAQETLVTVDTGVTQLTLTSLGAGVKSVQMLDYRVSRDDAAPPVEIAPVIETANTPLTAELRLGSRQVSLRNAAFVPSKTRLILSQAQPDGAIVFRAETSDGMIVEREYRFRYRSYVFEVDTQVGGVQLPEGSAITLFWGPGLRQQHEAVSSRRRQTGTLPRSYIDGKIFKQVPEEGGQPIEKPGQIAWTALADTYFAAVLIPYEPVTDEPVNGTVITRQVQEEALEIGLRTAINVAQPMQAVRVYVGPKQQQLLEAAEPFLSKKLIDLGWLHPLAWPMVGLLRFVHGIVQNYGIAIIVVTLLIKIVTWPLTQKSYKSMQGMQKLQPKIKELQLVYKDDKQAMNRAMMQIYRDQKVNPMGSCLPMLLQIPFFFAFYNALLYSIEMRHAPFICWGTELSLFRLFGNSWPGAGVCDLSVYDPTFIMPLLMGVGMLAQQRMTPMTTADPMQAKMMQFMPLIFLFFFIKAPAGLVLYWLMNTVLSVLQQLLVNRPRPATVEAEATSKG